MTTPRLAIKVDVDTDRGTKFGVPALRDTLSLHKAPATFLFSLGPDNTGRSIRRIFRPGFFAKVQRTNVVSTYGMRTLVNGVILPGPIITKRNGDVMRSVEAAGFEVGIHSWDHVYWQDKLMKMSRREVFKQVSHAMESFEEVFGHAARTAGTAGWQANGFSLEANDFANLSYASDCRGRSPFFPAVDDWVFDTLQIPTTLPTLDELLGRADYPNSKLTPHYLSRLVGDRLNVLTIHAEIEGMGMFAWFKEFLAAAQSCGVEFVALETEAERLLKTRESIPAMKLCDAPIDGRSGRVATQGAPVAANHELSASAAS